MRTLLFCLGALFIVVPEIFRVYYIMPFPASQEDVPTDLRQVCTAYWLHNNIRWIRLVGVALMIGPFLHYMKRGGAWRRSAALVTVALCVVVFYAFNYKFMADKMFLPPTTKVMQQPVLTDSTRNDLVIAVEHKMCIRDSSGGSRQAVQVPGRPAVLLQAVDGRSCDTEDLVHQRTWTGPTATRGRRGHGHCTRNEARTRLCYGEGRGADQHVQWSR